MERITGLAGITISYDRYGSGPPLVMVHGGFGDHITNWQEVKLLLQERFTVYPWRQCLLGLGSSSDLGQTRAGSRSPGPGPAPSVCSLTVRPVPAQDDAGSAGAREVAARPRPPRRAATAAGAGFGGRPNLAGRFAEVALIVPSMKWLTPSRPSARLVLRSFLVRTAWSGLARFGHPSIRALEWRARLAGA
jgi:hypothetical protein